MMTTCNVACDHKGNELVCKQCPHNAKGEKQKSQEKRPKYNNKKIRVDGIVFDSKKEAEFYLMIKEQTKQGLVRGFCLQPKFILVEGNDEDLAITYRADFIVFKNDGSYEIVDTKGYVSSEWKRKLKQFRLKYPNLELEVV